MIYKTVFNLTGTEKQQQIVKDALDAIKFPFERLKFRRGTATIGWANLNGQALNSGLPQNAEVPVEEIKATIEEAVPLTEEHLTAYPEDVKVVEEQLENPRPHRHHEEHHEPETEAGHSSDPTRFEPLMGRLNGREYILGVFYPYSGDIYIDNLLVNYPSYAQTTVSAEVAHGVDEFLPMNSTHREQIMMLVNGGTVGDLTWWEKVDYGSEYYNLVGETFMILFTYAYSDLGFEGAEDFTYHGDNTMGDEIRAILGINRTDEHIPAPDSNIPTTIVIEPTKEEEPTVEEPVTPEPVVPEPTVEEPIVPEVPAPVIEEPPVDDPDSAPSVEAPPVTEPVVPPVVEEPVVPETPVVEEPAPVEEVPTPTVEEPTPVPAPVEEPPVVEAPVEEVPQPEVGGAIDNVPEGTAIEDIPFVKHGRSKVYHLPSHYEKKTGVEVTDRANLRLCKYCAKHIPIDIRAQLV
jgi:hypothetical protein